MFGDGEVQARAREKSTQRYRTQHGLQTACQPAAGLLLHPWLVPNKSAACIREKKRLPNLPASSLRPPSSRPSSPSESAPRRVSTSVAIRPLGSSERAREKIAGNADFFKTGSQRDTFSFFKADCSSSCLIFAFSALALWSCSMRTSLHQDTDQLC